MEDQGSGMVTSWDGYVFAQNTASMGRARKGKIRIYNNEI